jgi:hypothetical protein
MNTWTLGAGNKRKPFCNISWQHGNIPWIDLCKSLIALCTLETSMQYPYNPMEIKEGPISKFTLTLHCIFLAMNTFA